MIGYLVLVTLQNTKKYLKKKKNPNEDLETILLFFFFGFSDFYGKKNKIKTYFFSGPNRLP